MAAKKAKPKKALTPAKNPSRTLLWVMVKGLLAIALVASVIAGIVWVGNRAGEQVADRSRYTVRVADISCEAPLGKDRLTFLTEVRYKGDLSETVQSVDPSLKDRLTAAFARHPWVAEVKDVSVQADGGIHVSLRFRTPVLAVKVSGESSLRAVDKSGILLPSVTETTIAQLITPVLPPTRQEGELWDDPTVRRAAELAELYRPRQIEKTDKGWRLTQADGRTLVVSY